ncbi:MAG: hypothetical protein AAFX40_14475 [Cyanobacteria bacterium J06639_1]
MGLGLSAQDWERYHRLVAERRAETLSGVEQAELIQTSDLIEQANAKRMRVAIALAKLRSQSLAEVWKKLVASIASLSEEAIAS